jgi:dienelactone hydrolase
MIRRLSCFLLLVPVTSSAAPSYLLQLVTAAEQRFEKEVPDKAAWLANRDRYRSELKEMLGLEPEPPRGDLKATVTGTVPGDGIVVEKLHYQSLPGLYVTANFYRPASSSGRLPTILYYCGHGKVIGPDGRSSGNKTHYQHHGVWFARHGYNCLILDTLQLGEIMGDHHGTYKFNRWWWVSRGYTPAGVETWAGIRALDYLATRPDVDMEKIGVTGRSGGGAYTWFLAAVDDRVKVAAPTAGITTLRDHIINGVIEGHCDCMYFVNLYGWDFDKLAALTAPRPLLISNTDKDNIFPLGGVLRIYDSTRRLYKLLDAEKNIGLQISEGPHKDTQPLNSGAFHWFERHLKGADPMAVIKEPAVAAFKSGDLRVFAELPNDEINTRIDETFVPMFTPPPVPQTKDEWEKLKAGWVKVLREKVLIGKPVSRGWFLPRTNPGTHEQRRYQLAGRPLDVLAVLNLAESFQPESPGKDPREKIGKTVLEVNGKRAEGGIEALYACILSDAAPLKLSLDLPSISHRQGPHFFGILKYMDVPQAVAMAAERCKVRITGRREDWTWALQTAEKLGFAANLEVVPALEVLDVKKIWDAAPHNAFTSLTKFKDEWFITFRESSGHVPGTDGAVRVLASKDGNAWESAALLTESGVDLRDPKFCASEDGELFLTMGGSIYDGKSEPGAERKFMGARNRVSVSTDGRSWTPLQVTCEASDWLWRVTECPTTDPTKSNRVPRLNKFYGISYPTNVPEADAKLSLWESADGFSFKRMPGPDPGRSLWLNETTIRFDDDGNMLALARSDRKRTNAHFGFSKPPYKEWSWTDTGHIVHGPDFIRMKDGRMVYSGRDIVNGKANTTVGILTASGNAMPMVVLPSGGDTSYPGLAEGPDGQLLVSYYSSHEGKTAIYFAKLKLAK